MPNFLTELAKEDEATRNFILYALSSFVDQFLDAPDNWSDTPTRIRCAEILQPKLHAWLGAQVDPEDEISSKIFNKRNQHHP